MSARTRTSNHAGRGASLLVAALASSFGVVLLQITNVLSTVISGGDLSLVPTVRTSLSIVVDDFPESVSRLSCIKFYHGPVGRCNDSIRIRVRSVITCDRIGSNACLGPARRSTVTR